MTRVALVVLGVALGAASAAAAPVYPRVRLELEACGDVPLAEVRRIVRVELGAFLTDSAALGPDVTRVQVVCRDGAVLLRVEDPLTGKSMTRPVDLAAAPAGIRARLVALAVTELVAASWTELVLTPEPAVPPAGPPPPGVARAAGRDIAQARLGRSPHRVRIIGAFDLTGFPSGPTLLGGGVRVAQDRPGWLGWALDVMLAHGTAAPPEGSIAADLVTAAPTVLAHHGWRNVAVRSGVGVRLGAVRLTGAQPDALHAGGSVAGAFVGPLVTLGASARLWRLLVVEVAGEAGWVVRPISGLVEAPGGTRRELNVDGAFLGVQLGLGFFS